MESLFLFLHDYLERFGIQTDEILLVTQALLDHPNSGPIGLALWDVYKEVEGRELLGRILRLDYGNTEFVAGN